MIKINLLNSYKEAAGTGAPGGVIMSDDDEKRQLYIDFFKRVFVLAIGPLGFYIYETQTIPVLEAKLIEINQKYNEIKEFNDSKQGLAEEIKKYEAEQARFNAQMDFINKIDRDKVNEYRLFEHLKTSTPENVWIEKLELSDNNLHISAQSDSVKGKEKFTELLSNAEFITNLVPLNQTVKAGYAGTDVSTVVFTIKAQLISRNQQ